jgi:hypothetical protein
VKKTKAVILASTIESKIYSFRGQRVMLDSDLAELYGVNTKRLNEQVKRNPGRFPSDFMFRLTSEEMEILRSQIATSKKSRGGRRYPPYVFTEHGAVMLAGVLNSQRAIETSIFVVRAFIRMREILSMHKEFARKLSELERRITGHDEDIKVLIGAIKQLIQPSVKPKKQIGFRP